MRTAAVIGLSFLLLFSSFTLILDDSSADSISIDIVYADGSKIPDDQPLIETLLIFTTYTDKTGTKYCLDAETELTEVDCYLRITSDSGAFNILSLIPDQDISGSLRKSGLLIKLSNEDTVFESRLDTENKFEDDVMDGETEAVLLPNVLYKIDIFTEK